MFAAQRHGLPPVGHWYPFCKLSVYQKFSMCSFRRNPRLSRIPWAKPIPFDSHAKDTMAVAFCESNHSTDCRSRIVPMPCPLNRSVTAILLNNPIERTVFLASSICSPINCSKSCGVIISDKLTPITRLRYLPPQVQGFPHDEPYEAVSDVAGVGYDDLKTYGGAGDGTRTRNLRFTKPLLCQLSYASLLYELQLYHRCMGVAMRGSCIVGTFLEGGSLDL